MSRSAGGAVSCCQRSLLAVGAAAAVCLLVYLVVPFGGVGEGVRSVFGSVPLLSSPAPGLGLRPPSALLRQPTAARCNRLPLPGPLANASALPAEPAAVRDPVTGEWLIFFRYQEEVQVGCSGGKQECRQDGGSARTRSHPLMVRLGYGALPDLRLVQSEAQRLQLHESYLRLRQQQSTATLRASAWRPFAWKGGVYLSHWLSLPPAQDRVAMAKLDLEHNSLSFVYRFDTLEDELAKLKGLRARTHERSTSTLEQMADREAGWGFVAEKEALVIYASILPCTVALEFDDSAPDGAVLRSKHCYEDAAAKIESHTGLDIAEQEDMLSSGHPVAWDMERGPKSRELLAIVHRRGYDTEHWAVRIDRASQRVTHISAGPLLRTLDFKPEGFLEDEITLNTYHIIDRGEPEGRILRVVYGEGEHLFCWMDISTEVIVWHALPAARGSKTQTRMRFKATGTIS